MTAIIKTLVDEIVEKLVLIAELKETNERLELALDEEREHRCTVLADLARMEALATALELSKGVEESNSYAQLLPELAKLTPELWCEGGMHEKITYAFENYLRVARYNEVLLSKVIHLERMTKSVSIDDADPLPCPSLIKEK